MASLEIRDQALLCNDMRFPDLWFPLYRSICAQRPATPEEAIANIDPLGLSKREWQKAYRALQIMGALSTKREEPAPTDPKGIMEGFNHPLEETPFKVWLITLTRALAKANENGWDRQAHFALTFRYFLESDIHYARREQVVARNLSDFLRKEACPIQMNVQKLSYWIMMASHLGLATRVSGGAIIVIDPGIFHQILLCMKKNSGTGAKVRLEEFVRILDKNVFFVPTKAQGLLRVLTPLVSQTVWRAHRTGLISLDSRGDKGHIQLTDIPAQTQVFTDVELRL